MLLLVLLLVLLVASSPPPVNNRSDCTLPCVCNVHTSVSNATLTTFILADGNKVVMHFKPIFEAITFLVTFSRQPNTTNVKVVRSIISK